jgi:hypothetical protein
MKKFIILTPEGSTTAPNENLEVNNLQILGIVENINTQNEAIHQLLSSHPWITEAGFNVEKFVVYGLC